MEDASSSSDNENNKSKSKSSLENKNVNEISPRSDLQQEKLTNYYSYIEECSNKIEESRENYINNLEELKSKTTELKSTKLKNNNEYSISILEEYIKIFDDHYSIFSKTKEILSKCNNLNDEAQDMQFSYQKSSNSISYFKEMHQKINQELIKKVEENEHLRQKIKEMNNIKKENEYFIYLTNEKNKNKIDEKTENKNNIEIKNKLDNLIEENKELKRKYSQVITESVLFKDYVNQEYILKQESTRRMSGLLSKIDLYENKIDKLQNKINEIENEENKKKEDKKDEEEENIINLENPKSISEDSSIKQGINLEDLLDNPDDEEEEGNEEEKMAYPKGVMEENKLNNSKNPPIFKEYDIDINKSSLLNLCPISKQYQKQKLNNIKIYTSPFSYSSSQSNSIINMTKKKNAKSVYTSKIKKKELINCYKIFFFLLLKSLIINYDILQTFQKKDFKNLFEECQNEKIPFNKYYDWIINRININKKNNDYDYGEESSIINSFICTSLI